VPDRYFSDVLQTLGRLKAPVVCSVVRDAVGLLSPLRVNGLRGRRLRTSPHDLDTRHLSFYQFRSRL